MPVLALLALAAALLRLAPVDPVQAQDDSAPAGITAGPAIISIPESGDAYGRSEVVSVAFTFSQPVIVTGKPRPRLAIGSKKRWAKYDHSDQDGAQLIFAYVVKPKDMDDDGISIGKNKLDLNGGTISDGDGNRARLRHSALPDQAGQKVDGIKVNGKDGQRQTQAAPAKPMDLWSTRGDQSVTLMWCAPDSEHHNPTITKYRFVIAALSTDTYHTNEFSDTVTATPTAE